ncbi:hypothetical protein [Paenibacillus azoreducens]|uniref:Uncharacterized protein n=1 Tax=Paenibacillus azoreducens TaxID=116718 RepID=A0A919YGT5_9BACL|nr:hypothetical protein [Paenibacillus azoreducens]GIO51411.1 hypothetical protein J34TS1_61760 [Paenibacillus azoreducens]
MNSVYNQLVVEPLTGNLREDICSFLVNNKCPKTAEHCMKVGEMARDLFQIRDQEILGAVGCHTTLKKDSTLLDKVLFVADKIEWDQSGTPPYLQQIMAQLDRSLEHAAFAYIHFLWEQRETLRVVHPWLRDAYFELEKRTDYVS